MCLYKQIKWFAKLHLRYNEGPNTKNLITFIDLLFIPSTL